MIVKMSVRLILCIERFLDNQRLLNFITGEEFMKLFLVKILVVTTYSIFLSACNGLKTDQVSDHPEIRSSSTVFPTFTNTAIISSPTNRPTVTQTLTPTATPFPTSPEFATMDAFGSKCKDPDATLETKISPNGKWFTASCFRDYMGEYSPVHVVSIDHSKEWKDLFPRLCITAE